MVSHSSGCLWVSCSVHLCFCLLEIFKLQNHKLSSEKMWWHYFCTHRRPNNLMNCHPLRVLLSISSTLMIKEGNTGEFFSALLVLMVESIMSAAHALFFFFFFYNPNAVFLVWFWWRFRKVRFLIPEVLSKRMLLSVLCGVTIFTLYFNLRESSIVTKHKVTKKSK